MQDACCGPAGVAPAGTVHEPGGDEGRTDVLVEDQDGFMERFEEFYRGKTLSLIIPNAPGGSFDLYARLVASHLGRFMPGRPSIVPQNMLPSASFGT